MQLQLSLRSKRGKGYSDINGPSKTDLNGGESDLVPFAASTSSAHLSAFQMLHPLVAGSEWNGECNNVD